MLANRRELLSMLGWSMLTNAASRIAAAENQPPLLVWFASSVPTAAARWIGFLKRGLEKQGYIDGQHYRLEERYAEFQIERLPAVADEVIRLKPAIIIAGAVDTATVAKKATSTIPIVSGALADAVHLGLVASYARPGGNVTGITPYIDGLPAKQMEFALQVVPNARKIGLLGNMNDPKAPPQRDELVREAAKIGAEVIIPKIESPNDIDDAGRALKAAKVEVAIVLQTTMLLANRKHLAQLLGLQGVPAVYGYREHVDDGGLVSYGIDLGWCWRHVAIYVDKILKGTAPGDLPIEFPPKVQMVANLTAAKALGIQLSPSILGRADDIIE